MTLRYVGIGYMAKANCEIFSPEGIYNLNDLELLAWFLGLENELTEV